MIAYISFIHRSGTGSAFMDDVPIISIVAHFVSVRYMQVEQVSQLATFSEGLLDYHQQCTEILKGLVETLQMK